MPRIHDLPCPATAFTAEVNLNLLAVEAIEEHGADLGCDEIAAALRASLALMQLAEGNAADRRARRRTE